MADVAESQASIAQNLPQATLHRIKELFDELKDPVLENVDGQQAIFIIEDLKSANTVLIDDDQWKDTENMLIESDSKGMRLDFDHLLYVLQVVASPAYADKSRTPDSSGASSFIMQQAGLTSPSPMSTRVRSTPLMPSTGGKSAAKAAFNRRRSSAPKGDVIEEGDTEDEVEAENILDPFNDSASPLYKAG